MKTILLLLFAAGIATTAAAQDNKYAKNYKVCRSETGYEICPDQTSTNINNPPTNATPEGQSVWKRSSFISPMSEELQPTGSQIPTRKALESSYPLKDWQEKEYMRRNINYGSGRDLPPTTGEIR